jgi:branched-chain amino acid transport system ATP-binding protein
VTGADSVSDIGMQDVVAGYVPGHPVLRGVTLTAARGKLTVVLGPNGAGKSTVLKVLSGFLAPSGGLVTANGTDIGSLPAQRHLELGIALLPQGRSVFPELTVEENLELGGWLWRGDRTRLRRAVDAALARYAVLGELRRRPAGSLSGGQQRTLEIARLLVTGPQILLIDEPSAGLSPMLADQVYRELATLKREGRTILLVDQGVRAAIGIADYVYVLNSGRNDVEGDRSAFEEGALGGMVRGWLGV